MAVDQLERQWGIINLLCRKRRTTVSELSREYGVNARTIRRDLDKLSTIFPIVDRQAGRRKYWSLIDGYKEVPPVTFLPTELYALKEGTRLLKSFGEPFLRPTLESIHHKIRSTFDDERMASFEGMKRIFSLSLSTAKDYSRRRDFLRSLFAAAAKQERVEIAYRGLKDARPKIRKVDPYRLWYRDGAVYLIGLCHLRREIRMFDVDRISLINHTDENFLIPENFDFGEYTRHAFSVMIETPVRVRIRFVPEIARYIEERQWHPSREVVRNRDGSIVLELTVGGTLEIKRWILSFGPQAEVLEPQKLIEEIREDLEKMQALYLPGKGRKNRGTG
ncbi:MAG: YafY family transcriptional regulator [Deltaproteobacteria bacterium]|nr:YafY family transcriptional regulator [Deltaproteobacteria bacterium]